jgi:hypothetical protein
MLQKFRKLLFPMVAAMVIGCSDGPSPATPDVKPTVPGGVSFNVVGTTDTILRVRVSWAAPQDGFGPIDFYRHTMTSSKVVVDASTGPLPDKKQINGTSDTVSIKVRLVEDSVTLISRVWSVRRGLESTTPAQGTLFVRRGDRPPPPPDSIRVDTIVIPIPSGLRTSTYTMSSILTPVNVNNQTSINLQESVTVYKFSNYTVFSLK